jgi:hypothetical protein
MNWWLFPPETREVQCDEKWAFVGKKEANCDPNNPDDQWQGDHWDHVALDAEHRLVLSVVPGKRTAENVQALLQDVKKRLDGRTPTLITTDEYSAYKTAVLQAFGEERVPETHGKTRPSARSLFRAEAGLELRHGA